MLKLKNIVKEKQANVETHLTLTFGVLFSNHQAQHVN